MKYNEYKERLKNYYAYKSSTYFSVRIHHN